jgi:hypothetical protein
MISSSSADTSSAPAHEDRQPPRTSAAAIAPSLLVSAVAVIAYRIKWPASTALSYGKGAKWTMIRTTSFFGSCNNPPYRHRHRARTG